MGKFADTIREIQTEDQQLQARAAGVQAPNIDPDGMGRAMRVAEARGLPVGVVADSLPEYDEQVRLDGLADAASASPALARWLGDPNQAAVAADDTGVLKQLGRRFDSGLLAAHAKLPWLPLPQSALDLEQERKAAAQQPSIGPTEQPSWFSELIGKFESGWHQGKAGLALTSAGINPVQVDDSVARGLGYSDADSANAAMLGAVVAESGRRAQAADMESASTARGFQEIAAAEQTKDTGKIIRAVATNPRAVMATVAQSLGSTAPQLLLSAALPASRLVAGLTAGAGSFSTEQGMTVLDAMGDAGVDTSDPAQVAAFINNKPAMAAAREKALKRGVAVGVFDALTAGFAGRLLANTRRSIASVAGRVAGEGAIQAAGGAAGEATAQLASEGKISSQSDIILEAAAEVPTFLAEGRGQIAEARRAALHNADRFDAHQEQRAISDLVNLAAQSKTRQRAANRFESLIRDMTDEGDDTIYLSADGARKLFQSAAADGDQAGAGLESLVDADALREAIATGGEVAIPLARYVSAVSPEQHAAVADQVRLQPGGRHDIPAVSPEEIQQAIDAGLAEASQQEARENGPAGQVYDDVYGQLLSRQDEALARQNASVVQSVYRNLAERVGTDALSLYNQFKINIPGATTDTRAAPRGIDIDVDPFLDALRTGQLPTDREVYGDTLSSALHAAGGLRDSGGELANMDAAKARPGLVNNIAGMSLDDALTWAYQEGFITEAPTQLREQYSDSAPDINTLLDLLAQDLGGNPVYRPGAMNVERAAFRERAQSLQDELDQRGIDLQQTDNATARDALGYGQRTLEQPAFHGTPHQVDRFSLQKIGSGEGNQAYGWGLYFAGRREIAEWYAKTVSQEKRDSDTSIAASRDRLKAALRENDYLGFDTFGQALSAIRNDPNFLENWDISNPDVLQQALADYVQRSDAATGKLYQVEVPEDEDLLNYDKPLREQSRAVLQALEPYIAEAATRRKASSTRRMNSDEARASVMRDLAKDAYADIVKQKGGARQASEYLLSLGVPGLRYLDAASRHADGDTTNYVVWDENAVSEPTRLFQKDGESPRGSVTFGGQSGARTFNIELLKGMDASTFMHEMGHVYLEVLNDLAAREGAPAQIVNDMSTLNDWLGRDAGTAFTTEQHEQFARGFEAYLREGKAPSAALRRAFAAFKVWLTALYRSALQLKVDLTDDVRGVMDRIIASDAEIADARAGQYQEALITDALSVGMSPEQFESYSEAVRTARSDAEAALGAEVLRAEQREQQAWYNREKRATREQVLGELREHPVYRTARLLRNGKLPNGEEAPAELRVKLSKDDLLDKFGQSFLRNLVGMYSVEGGVKADEAAALYGFGSGREMIDALVNAPRLSDAVASETDARMRERHPDPATDGTLPDRALVAVHRDRQADVMLREVRALEQHVSGRQVSQAAVIKGVARGVISQKKLRHLQPATYRAAEARAGKEAFEAAAKQDWPAALAARRRQLLNFELFREATRARDEAARAAKYLAKFGETKTRARLGKAGADYLDQVDGLLDRFDFRKISDKAADRRSSLAQWIAKQEANGIDVNLPQKLLDETFSTPYREMTMQDLRGLRDAVRAIDHLARLKGKLLLAGEVRDAEQVDNEMASSLLSSHAVRQQTTGDRSTSDKVRQAFMQGRVLQATATDLARELDGFKDQGAIWRNTVGVMRDAVNNWLNPALNSAQEELAKIYTKHYTKAEIRAFGERVPMPEVNGDLWSKSRLLSLALNWGNAGNREAILTQAKARMSAAQVGALLNRLDSRDWAFVEDVWRLIDSQWPAIAEAQKRRTGLVPEKVQPDPFTVHTSDGKTLEIPGGYYPLKYEADSIKTMKDEADDFYNSIRTGRSAKAATKNGHTIERVGSGGRTVRLDTGVIQQHLRDVLRDVHLGDAVNYVHSVLNGQGFKEAVDATGTQEYQRAMEVWLKDVAAGEIGPRVWHERAMRAARQNFTASVLTFKLTSALLQLSGVVPTTVAVGSGPTMAGVQQYLAKPRAMTRYVRQASPYMDARLRTHIEAVQTVADAEAGRFAAGKAAAIRAGYWMIGRVQSVVDVVTWLAAEQAGMRKFGGNIDQARAYADDVVTRAQGSGEFIDKSPLQRGTLGDNVRQTEWIKAMTALQGYMIAKGNLAYEQTRKANLRNPKQAMKWMADMVMLFSVEGIITAALTGKLPDDDDDDGILDDLGEFAAKDAAGTLFGSLPGGGVLVDQFRGYDSSGVVAGAAKAYAELFEQVKQGELDKGVVKAMSGVLGVTLGLPTTQINKTIDAIQARRDGRDVSFYEYLTGPKKEN